MRLFKHFFLVTKHKWLVFKYSIRVGIPFQGIVHDLSKFSPTEFFRSAHYYLGNQSPINAERAKHDDFSLISIHHSKRNKHHFEYWLDFYRGNLLIKRMPYKYALEYVIDMLAASKVYKKKHFTYDYVIDFFLAKMDYYPMHPDSKQFVLDSLLELRAKGFKGYKKKRRKELYEQNKNHPNIISYAYDNTPLLIPKIGYKE